MDMNDFARAIHEWETSKGNTGFKKGNGLGTGKVFFRAFALAVFDNRLSLSLALADQAWFGWIGLILRCYVYFLICMYNMIRLLLVEDRGRGHKQIVPLQTRCSNSEWC